MKDDASSGEEDGDSDPTTSLLERNGMEVWPPPSYDPLAPLAIPLGPKTDSLRSFLSKEVSFVDL